MGYWIPRVDMERDLPFLPTEPEEMIRGGNFNLVPLITGIATHEGSLLQSRMYSTINFYCIYIFFYYIPLYYNCNSFLWGENGRFQK